jgi:hypothetical protein
LAEIVRLDRAHQTMIWSRVRQVNALRSLLREHYPAALAAFGTDLASRQALAVLGGCPRAASKTLLRRAGRPRTWRRPL